MIDINASSSNVAIWFAYGDEELAALTSSLSRSANAPRCSGVASSRAEARAPLSLFSKKYRFAALDSSSSLSPPDLSPSRSSIGLVSFAGMKTYLNMLLGVALVLVCCCLYFGSLWCVVRRSGGRVYVVANRKKPLSNSLAVQRPATIAFVAIRNAIEVDPKLKGYERVLLLKALKDILLRVESLTSNLRGRFPPLLRAL